MLLSRLAWLSAVVGYLAAPVLAHAANIEITDTPGVSTTVAGGYFEDAFSAGGTVFSNASGYYAGTATLPDTSSISFSGSWDDTGLAVTFGTLYFVPFAGSNQIVAELVYTASNSGSTGTISGTVTDAAAAALGTVPTGTSAADIGVVGSSLAFTEPYSSNSFSVSAPVPEPGSAGMLVAGLLGLGLVARRRRA